MAEFDVVAAVASRSPKPDGGDDRVRRFATMEHGAGAVLCDGVGAIPGSAAFAEGVCDFAVAHMEGRGVGPGIWELDGPFVESALDLSEGATTLVVVGADATGLVGHLLIGNGSLIEAEPTEPWPGRVSLRWTDIVLPQIQWEGGRPALRAYLSCPGGEPEVAKGYRASAAGRPRVYLACSDGIASDEDRALGPARDGRIWKEVPAALARLLERLADAWASLFGCDQSQADRRLASVLEEALDDLAGDPGLDDDASIGAVLLRPLPAEAGGEER